ncbi:MAG: hypothetical protein ABI596_00735 [Pyrinomonadaceae bacterium]
MAKKRVVKKHSVKAKFHVKELTKAGSSLELEIYAAQQKVGTLVIGSGSLFWYGGKRRIRKRIPWTRFAEMMNGLAYPRG